MRSLLKYSRFLVILMIIFRFSFLSSQDKPDFLYHDSITYALYTQNKWDSLISSSQKALKSGLDYYYLRMRAGIAFYEKGKYLQAEKHFKKALKLNEIDAVSREYIYYSKLFSGKEKEASLFYKRNEELLKGKVESKNKAIRDLFVDVVYHLNFENEIENLFNLEDLSGQTGYQTVTKRFYLGSFLMSHDITRFLTLYHGGTVLRKYNYLYSSSAEGIIVNNQYQINQNQYYINLSFYPGADINLNASIHYINLVAPEFSYSDRGFGTIITVPGFKDNYLLSRFSIQKHINLFSARAGLSFSNLNNKNQIQKDIHLVFYPLGNRNFYTASSFYHISENSELLDDNFYVFRQIAGFKMTDNIWTEAGFSTGEIKNAAFNNGFIVYNGYETIRSMLDLGFIIPLDKINLRINGSYLDYYSVFNPDNTNTTNINKLEFSGLTFIAEIKWNF